jgi:tetratricopeptide (TPR) repeat protein
MQKLPSVFLLATLTLATLARAADTPTYSPDLALKLYHAGKYTEGETLCKTAIAQIEKSDGPTSPKLAFPLDDLASIYLRVGKFAEAKPLIARAESVLDKSTRDGALTYAHLCINKGWLEYSLGDVSRAEAIFKEGRTLIQKYEKEPTIDLAELINNIGLAYADNDDDNETKVAEAKLLLIKAYELRKRLTGENSPETLESVSNLGTHILFHGNPEKEIPVALSTLEKASALAEKVYGTDNPETAASFTNLALVYHLTGQNDRASAELQKAMPITEKFMGTQTPDYAYELQILGQILQSQEKYKEAEDAYQRAVTITKNSYGPTKTAVASALDYLAGLYEAMGDEKKQADTNKLITKIRGRDI